MKNFMFALMKAVEKDQTTLSQQQIVDSKTTMLQVKIEEQIYQYWNNDPSSPINKALDKISKYAKYSGNHSDEKHSSKEEHDTSEVNKWQAKYNAASAKAQSAENQQDGTVKASQGQTSSDASNLQMKAQMLQGINGLESALSNMLGRITA